MEPAPPMLTISHKSEIVEKIVEKHFLKLQYLKKEHTDKIKDFLMKHKEELAGNLSLLKCILDTTCPAESSIVLGVDEERITEIYKDFNQSCYDQLEENEDQEDFFEFVFNYFKDKIMSESMFRKLLILLSITNTGLTVQELCILVPELTFD